MDRRALLGTLALRRAAHRRGAAGGEGSADRPSDDNLTRWVTDDRCVLRRIEGSRLHPRSKHHDRVALGHGNPQRLPDFASEMARLNVDVIVAANDAAGRAAHQGDENDPDRHPDHRDPIGGFAASLSRPGGNVIGLTMLGPDTGAKRLQILKEALPELLARRPSRPRRRSGPWRDPGRDHGGGAGAAGADSAPS